MSAIDLFVARSVREEGERSHVYDDATGLEIKAPVGNASWGRGFNLAQIGSPELYDVIERYLIGLTEARLLRYTWYRVLDEPRQSVLLDVGYNAGIGGLFGYPKMLAAIQRQDWICAAAECTTKNPKLKSRYEVLSRILATGEA